MYAYDHCDRRRIDACENATLIDPEHDLAGLEIIEMRSLR